MLNVNLLTQLDHIQEDRACVHFPPRSQHACGPQEVLNKFLLKKINCYFETALSNLKIVTFSVYQSYHIICKNKSVFDKNFSLSGQTMVCFSGKNVVQLRTQPWLCPLSHSFLIHKRGVQSYLTSINRIVVRIK